MLLSFKAHFTNRQKYGITNFAKVYAYHHAFKVNEHLSHSNIQTNNAQAHVHRLTLTIV